MKALAVIIAILAVVVGFYYFGQKAAIAPLPEEGEDFSQDIKKDSKIKIFAPKEGDNIGLPLKIKGSVFDLSGSLFYRLYDEDGGIIAKNVILGAEATRSAEFARSFEINDSYPESKGEEGILEIYTELGADEEAINKKIIVPVYFQKIESENVKVFFGLKAGASGKEGNDCEDVYSLPRRVVSAKSIIRSAIEELLKGPTIGEEESDYFTSINKGVQIQKLLINNGILRADFSVELEEGVAGSCRVLAIRSQIEKTAKQFPEVKQVIISINGRIEDILQP